ncbi:HGxxPAAW family protein [Streptomyces phyllanthi]|uniref:HGxxPAAW family protein n=1 Tax=Streptomyces phyllanthi TaxID=1803180 RepID=UPI0031E8FDBE
MSAHQYDEGHTVAGWTGFGIATVGTVVVGVGICTGSALGVWGGIGVVGVSVLVTWALVLAGWGKRSGPRPVDQWGMRVRDRSAREGHPGCWGCRLAGRRPEGAVVGASVAGAAGSRGSAGSAGASGVSGVSGVSGALEGSAEAVG